MKRMKKNGFTLVELLAVIVVLAILVLLAMPRVTTMMENARINSFVVEGNELVKVAQTAFSDKELDNGEPLATPACFTVDQLIDEGYLDKTKGEIRGALVVDMVNNEIKVYPYISKQNYYIKINSTNYGKVVKNKVTTKKGAALYNGCQYQCRASGTNAATVECNSANNGTTYTAIQSLS